MGIQGRRKGEKLKIWTETDRRALKFEDLVSDNDILEECKKRQHSKQ